MLKFFRKHDKDPTQGIRDLFANYELPSFPTAVLQVLSMLRDPEVPLSKIGERLYMDPGMSVRVLRTANSAAFGLRRRVTHVNHAISLLGRSRLEAMILTIAVKDSLPGVESSLFDMKRFWHVAAQRACLARILARRLHPATEDESFTASLLQDMAIPVLAAQKQAAYCTLYNQWRENADTPLHLLEKDAFGYDHAYVGAIIAEEWELPEYLVSAISGHHKGEGDATTDAAVRLVSFLRDGEEDDGREKMVACCEVEYGLQPETVHQLIEGAFRDASEYVSMMN